MGNDDIGDWKGIELETMPLLALSSALATMGTFLFLGIIAQSVIAVVTLSIGISIVSLMLYLVAAQERMFRKGVWREFEYPDNTEESGRSLYDRFQSDLTTSMPNIKERPFHFPLNYYYSSQTSYIFDDDENALIVISEGTNQNEIDIYVTRDSIPYIPQIDSFLSSIVAGL